MARRRQVVTRGARRQTTWVGPADQGFLTVGTSASVIIGSFDASASGLASPTVVRTRGTVSVAPAASPAADLEIVGAYGLVIVTDAAFAAGQASIPHVFNDAGWDGWFVWGSFSLNVEFLDASGTRLLQLDQVVDSKAMRKMTDDETLVLMAASSVNAFRISMPLRLLFKLS